MTDLLSLSSLSLPHGRGISTSQRRLAWHFPAHRMASFDNRPRQCLPVTAWRHTLYGMPRKAMERARAPLVRQLDTTTFGTGIFGDTGLHRPCSDVLRPPRIVHGVLCSMTKRRFHCRRNEIAERHCGRGGTYRDETSTPKAPPTGANATPTHSEHSLALWQSPLLTVETFHSQICGETDLHIYCSDVFRQSKIVHRVLC